MRFDVNFGKFISPFDSGKTQEKKTQSKKDTAVYNRTPADGTKSDSDFEKKVIEYMLKHPEATIDEAIKAVKVAQNGDSKARKTTVEVESDGDGNVLSKTRRRKDGTKITTYYDLDGNITTKELYSKKGLLLHKKEYDEFGEVTESTKYKYDKQGKLTYSVTKDGDGNFVESHRYKYSRGGALKYELTNQADGTQNTKMYKIRSFPMPV